MFLTSGRAIPLSPGELREIGVDSRQIIAKQSSHWVHLDEPTLVIDTILEMAYKSDTALSELELFCAARAAECESWRFRYGLRKQSTNGW
jgi:hypothetical protein